MRMAQSKPSSTRSTKRSSSCMSETDRRMRGHEVHHRPADQTVARRPRRRDAQQSGRLAMAVADHVLEIVDALEDFTGVAVVGLAQFGQRQPTCRPVHQAGAELVLELLYVLRYQRLRPSILRAAAENPPASTTSTKVRIRVSVSMMPPGREAGRQPAGAFREPDARFNRDGAGNVVFQGLQRQRLTLCRQRKPRRFPDHDFFALQGVEKPCEEGAAIVFPLCPISQRACGCVPASLGPLTAVPARASR